MEMNFFRNFAAMKSRANKVIAALLRYGLPLLISVGLCYVLLRQVNLRDNVLLVNRYCHWQWIFLALALSVVSHIIRALRWNIQLRALGLKCRLWDVILSIFGTYAVNLVLPRLGEVWRTGYIARRQRTSFTTVFGSMLSDRLCDTLAVAIITLCTLVVSRGSLISYIEAEPGRLDGIKAVVSSPWVWTALGVIILGLWLWITRTSGRAVETVKGLWRSLWHGFSVIATMPGRLPWLLLTVALWGCYFVQLFVAFYAFDFTIQIIHRYTAEAALVCFILSTIAMALPSNGGIGPWQMAVVLGLSFYSTGITVPEGTTFNSMSIAFANCVMTTETLLLIALGLLTFGCVAWQNHRAKAVG